MHAPGADKSLQPVLPVCFASAGNSEPRDLTLDEISQQYDHLMSHGGPYNIQLSGGEPTVRNDLAEIITLGKVKGFTFFQLNTNGVRLAEEEGYTDYLAKAGVSTVFLQFDGLDDEIYRVLRGRALKDIKLRAIENCKRSGLPVVLVPTLAKGVNDQALGEIIQFALDHAPYVRGVHIQPMTFLGRNSMDPNEGRLTIPAVLRLIEAQTNGLMKAEDFSGGGAESPYCSFHASYLKNGDKLKALPRRQGSCCAKAVKRAILLHNNGALRHPAAIHSQLRQKAAAVVMHSQRGLRAVAAATHSQHRQRAAATAIHPRWTSSCSKQWKIRSRFPAWCSRMRGI